MSAATPLGAAVIWRQPDREPAEYPMFEVRELSATGALLAGPIVLEVGERLHLRLLAAEPVELWALIEAVSAERQLQVRFVDVDDDTAARLAKLAAEPA